MPTLIRRVLGRPYMAANLLVWNCLAKSSASSRIVQAYGRHLHYLARLRTKRTQSVSTFFFRNRPQLALLVRLLATSPAGSTTAIGILACSKGAEVYSLSYAVRRTRPDLALRMKAIDVSSEMVEFARAGLYAAEARNAAATTRITCLEQPSSIFERMSSDEMEELFIRDAERAGIKPEFRRDISWHVADAGDPDLIAELGLHDIIVANDFLCHMRPTEAERCLRNVARLVRPGGHLAVAGVDLDVRSKVARDLGWTPVIETIEEIHDGDPALRQGWPLEYWGLEPFNPRRKDWQMRYASVFRLGRGGDAATAPGSGQSSARAGHPGLPGGPANPRLPAPFGSPYAGDLLL